MSNWHKCGPCGREFLNYNTPPRVNDQPACEDCDNATRNGVDRATDLAYPGLKSFLAQRLRPLSVGDHIHISSEPEPQRWRRCDQTCHRVWSMLPGQGRVNLINHRGQMSAIARGIAAAFRAERAS